MFFFIFLRVLWEKVRGFGIMVRVLVEGAIHVIVPTEFLRGVPPKGLFNFSGVSRRRHP